MLLALAATIDLRLFGPTTGDSARYLQLAVLYCFAALAVQRRLARRS